MTSHSWKFEILKTTINEQLKVIASKAKDTDLPYVKEQFLEFCKNQKLKKENFDMADSYACCLGYMYKEGFWSQKTK